MVFSSSLEDIRKRSKEIIDQRKAMAEYRKYEAIRKEYERLQQLNNRNSLVNNKKANLFEKGFDTLGDLVGNVLTGAGKGIEGIVDTGLSAVGLIGGIFGSNIRDSIKNVISYDVTGNLAKPMNNFFDASLLNNNKVGNFIENVASGVGQMLPAVVTNILLPGSGMATMGVSAAGNATESAYNDGAGYYKGLLHGAVSGGIEAATEKIGGRLFGNSVIDDALGLKPATKTLLPGATSKIGKFIQEAIGEGVEEGLSELASPLAKLTYKGTDALKDYKDKKYWGDVVESALVGAATSFAYGGTVNPAVNKAMGRNVNIEGNLESISEYNKASQNLFAENKLTNDKSSIISKETSKNYKNIENILENQSDDRRKQLINKYGLQNKFDYDGKLKSEFATKFSIINDTNKQVNNNITKAIGRYISPNLKGRETEIQSDLDRITNELKLDYKIEVYDGELSETEQEAFTKTKQAINSLNEKSGNKLNIIIVKSNNAFNANIIDDKVYMGKDQFESGRWAKSLVHEYTHFMEGSEEYNKLRVYLAEDDDIWSQAETDVLTKGYGIEKQEIGRILKKFVSGENLSEEEYKYYQLFKSETDAHMTENMLGNEIFINKIVRSDNSLTEKILNKIKDLIEMFKSIKLSYGFTEYKRLKKAQSLYLKAVDANGKRYIDNRIITNDEELDTSEETKYSRKNELINKTFPPYNESYSEANQIATRWAYREDVFAGDQTLISYHDSWFVIEKFDDTDSGYLIMESVSKTEFDKIYEEIKLNGRSGRIISIQTAFTNYGKFDKSRNITNERKSSIDSLQIEYNSENTKIYGLDRSESQKWRIKSNGTGDSKNSSKNRQGKLNYSYYSQYNTEVLSWAKASSRKTEDLKYFYNPQTNMFDLIQADGKGEYTIIKSGNFDKVNKIYQELKNERRSDEGIDESINEFEKIVGRLDNRNLWNNRNRESSNNVSEQNKRKSSNDRIGNNKGSSSHNQYSIKDNKGNSLSEQQAEFFKDSKIRDENGNLLVVYHGTGSNDFTIFDMKKSKSTGLLGHGFYFTSNESEAKDRYVKRNGRVISAYLNIKNPLEVDLVHKSSIISKLRNEFAGKFDVDSYIYNYKYKDGIDTKKLLELVKKQGYDGIYNKSKGYYVAFEPKQIKNISNIRPTLNDDIRFALKDTDVKDLVAIHNTTESKLLQTIELGGLPMPSIAIIKDGIDFDGFGDISLIFKSDAIDPQKNKDNKVYSADAYTPRFPQVDYSLNEKELGILAKNLNTSVNMLKSNDFSEGKSRDEIIKSLKYNNKFIKYYANQFNEKERSDNHFNNYTEEIVDKILDKKYLRNNKDSDTDSENLRTFKSLHEDYTAENALKIMKENGRRNGETGNHFGGTVAEIIAAISKNLRSISAMHKNKDKIQNITEESNRLYQECSYELYDLANELSEKVQLGGKVDKFNIALNVILNVIRKTDSQVRNIYNESNILKLVNSDISRIRQLAEKIKQIPSKYFEAKPERVVEFEEILKVFVPKNTNNKIFEFFKEKGIDIQEYDETTPSRAELVKNLPKDIKFALKDRIDKESKKEYGLENGGIKNENLWSSSRGRNNGIDRSRIQSIHQGIEGRGETEIFRRTDGFSNYISKPRRLNKYDIDFVYESAKKLGFEIVFCNTNYDINKYLIEDKYLYVSEDATTQNIGLILDRIKPYKELNNKDIKTAYISLERWDRFLSENKNSFVARIGTQDFLDLTADKLAQRDIFNRAGELDEKELKNIEYPLYLKVNFETKEVIDHEGRHRVSALQKEGYTHIDIFIVPTTNIDNETIGRIDLIAQRSYDTNESIRKVPLSGLIKANSKDYSTFIRTKFKEQYDNGIRYSKKSTKKYPMTNGQAAKFKANYTQKKIYHKYEAKQIIENLIAEKLNINDKIGKLKGKAESDTIYKLFVGLNATKEEYRLDFAKKMADFIIENAVFEEMYDNDEINKEALHRYNILKEYRKSLNLDYIIDEIKSRYGKSANAIIMHWKSTNGPGISVDTIVKELQENGIFIESINEADIFFEILDMYNEAREEANKKSENYKSEYFEPNEINNLKNELVSEILKSYKEYGSKSTFSKIVDRYNQWVKNVKKRNKITNRLLQKIKIFESEKTGIFLNATQYKNELFKGCIDKLTKIKYRSNFNESGTRKILADLLIWYDKKNPILIYENDSNMGLYDEEIHTMIEDLASNSKKYLSVIELENLEKIIDYFTHLIEHNNKVYKNNQYVDAKPLAEKYINTIEKNKRIKVGWLSLIFDKIFNHSKRSYFQAFSDPITIARKMDCYEKEGFFTETIESLRNGMVKANVMEMKIRENLDKFLKDNKTYLKELKKRTINYSGEKIPASEALLLYMTLNREQAIKGLAYSGFAYLDANEDSQSVNGFTTDENLTLEELKELAKNQQKLLYEQFSELDKEYISIAEYIFNNLCKDAKRNTDNIRKGYTNVLDSYYVPIRRAFIAKNIDSPKFFDELNTVSNASFNKDTVKGAKNELCIDSLDKVLDRHIRSISLYANLATVIDEFNIIYNLNVGDNPNKVKNIKRESINVWKKGEEYIRRLISDCQGISRTKDGKNTLIGDIRSGYAKFQLGANPKVWFTQLSSLLASSSILDYSSIIKGLKVDPLKGSEVDKYCELAMVRNNDNSVAKAQGVLEKVDKFSDALMKPISMVDRFVITRLFGACQVQIQKETGLKVGTEENKIKAGELLQRIILETQQNSFATERSEAMRNSDEILKTFTMFSADSMKVVGRVIDSIGEVSVLKAKIRQETNESTKKALEEELKIAKKKAGKSVVALGSIAIFMAAISQAFKFLYNKKKDEDENIALNMSLDAVGNLLGGLPLIKDLYGNIVDGYDINNYAYSTINDLLDSFNSVLHNEGKTAQQIRNVVNAIGQLYGVPTRNIYNVFYGITSRIGTTGYTLDNLFYNQTYSSDLLKAIEDNDDDLANKIVNLMLDSKNVSIEDDGIKDIMKDLYGKGYNVFPKTINETIIYDGEAIELTKSQQKEFKAIYSKANDKVNALTKNSKFKMLEPEVKAKSIKYIYNYYYDEGIKNLLGVESDEKKYLFAQAIDISNLAMIVSKISQITSDKDKKGKTISGSKKTKIVNVLNSMNLTAVQKYMLMGYFGYKNLNGELQVKKYIQSLKLTKNEKETLFSMSGY